MPVGVIPTAAFVGAMTADASRSMGCFLVQGGQREIVLGVDDGLLEQAEKEGKSRRIPRDDVAALVTAALTLDSAKNRCAAATK